MLGDVAVCLQLVDGVQDFLRASDGKGRNDRDATAPGGVVDDLGQHRLRHRVQIFERLGGGNDELHRQTRATGQRRELEGCQSLPDVSRAKELLSHARWRAERECPRRWGSKQTEITINTSCCRNFF